MNVHLHSVMAVESAELRYVIRAYHVKLGEVLTIMKKKGVNIYDRLVCHVYLRAASISSGSTYGEAYISVLVNHCGIWFSFYIFSLVFTAPVFSPSLMKGGHK